jgi:hypothetical protein
VWTPAPSFDLIDVAMRITHVAIWTDDEAVVKDILAGLEARMRGRETRSAPSAEV